jgi:hypothetical protein
MTAVTNPGGGIPAEGSGSDWMSTDSLTDAVPILMDIAQMRPTRRRIPMSDWTPGELARIGQADELDLASVRRDGSLRNPVTMWVVRDGDDLYVRSMHGRAGAWFRGTQTR